MRKALAGISARVAGYQVNAVPESAKGGSIPAPVGGWDAISPLAAMPETNAIALENVFPQPGYVEVRKGHTKINIIAGLPAVESLMVYHAPLATNDKMFAAAGTGIYDVTAVLTASISAAAVSGLSNARWQHVNMATAGGYFLWMCNGADKPMTYDGSVFATTSITGITSSQVVNVNVFKHKIWMVLNGSISPSYLNTDSINGSATAFDLQGVFSQGGALQAIGTWTVDAGSGPDDYIVFITDRGEVAVYGGTDPSSDFTIKGVYNMGAPIGRRCITKVGADLAIICVDGVVPISKALITDRAAAISIAITKNIQPVMNQSARDYGSHFGWQLLAYPRGTRAILNVPVTENVQQQQYIMNTVTGAWARFTGENANCWALWRDTLYYGGNAGKVVKADCQGFDDDGNIDFSVGTAFNYAKTRGRLKAFNMCRALLTTDGQVSPGLAVNVDFSSDAVVEVLATPNQPSALWDAATWDGGTWPVVSQIKTEWLSVSGEGYCASIVMEGSVVAGPDTDKSQPVIFQINGWDILLTFGGFL